MATRRNLEKTYTVDFVKEQYISTSLVLDKHTIDCGPFYASYHLEMPLQNYIPNRILNVDNNLYLWRINEQVHKINFSKLEWSSKNKYSSIPKIIRVKHLGKEVDLLFSNSQAEIIGQDVVNLRGIISSVCSVCNEMFFTTDGKSLFFSNKFTDADVVDNMYTCNMISINKDYGKILFLHSNDKTLYIVCEKALLTMSVGESISYYHITTIKNGGIKIHERSVCADGSNLYFMSDNFLYCFDGKKIIKKEFLPPKYTLVYNGQASIIEGYYLCAGQLTPYGLSYGWYYDLLTNQVGMVEYMYTYADKGGHAYNKEKNIIRRFVRKSNTSDAKCVLQTKAINLGSNLYKRINLIEFFSTGKIILTVSGDFGSEDFTIDGFTQIKCNLISKAFTFSLNCKSDCLPLKDLKLKYNLLGG